MTLNKKQKAAFILAGARRCANQSMYHMLSQHPMIQVLSDDDSGYFSTDENFDHGNPKSCHYDNLYSDSITDLIKGEVSATYLSSHQAIARIHRYNPNIKLIVILRNPAERTYSHWQKSKHLGVEKRSFAHALDEEASSRTDELTRQSSYLSESLYSDYIETLLQYFSPHQLLFLKAEDLRDDTEVTMYQVFQFLDVPFLYTDTSAQEVGHYTESISGQTYNDLIQFFAKDISKTETLLGWNCSDWSTPRTAIQESKTYV